MSDTVLAFTLPLAAPPARVFAALTEARHLVNWFCDAAESAPGVDGRLVFRWTRATSSVLAYEGRWLEWEAPLCAAYRGGHAGYPDGDAGVVRFTLAANDSGGTRLEIRHQLPPREDFAAHVEIWAGAWPRALERLAVYLAPLPAPS